jgi:hypothetical protein
MQASAQTARPPPRPGLASPSALMYKTVLLPPAAFTTTVCISFLLAAPAIGDQAAAPRGLPLHHVSISPPTTTNPANAAPLPPPSCARGRSPFTGHARAREPLLILLTLAIAPTCPLALADPLSTRASTQLGDTSHAKPALSTPLRKQAPLGGHVAPCHRRRQSGFTKIGASLSGKRAFLRHQWLAPVQLNRRRLPMREIYRTSVPWSRFGGLAQAVPLEGRHTAQTTCRVRLGRQFCLAEI